jgi:TolB protein
MMQSRIQKLVLQSRLVVPVAFIVASALCFSARGLSDSHLGIFESSGDVGTVLHAGSAAFDSTTGRYTVVGSGENMWSTHDTFQFAWKKASGDNSIGADISFLGEGKNARAWHPLSAGR